jgi:hypothetical protein
VAAAMIATAEEALTPRWRQLTRHVVQQQFYQSTHRFNVVPSGRRSGKSELAKRRLVKRAIRGSDFDLPMYGYGAPTHAQVKRIAWNDLKRLVPKAAMRGKPSESELFIPLWHGGGIKLMGLDEASRVEGSPWDGFVLDEYGNMHPEVWGQHLRPALSDRNGWCDLIGVPEGRNHYFDIAEFAKAEFAADPKLSEWAYWHWRSEDILPAKEIAAAKHDLDDLTFEQEFGGSFVTFQGRAYYAFTDANKAPVRKLYEPAQSLIICLDFNVAPGSAVICQERNAYGVVPGAVNAPVTCIISDVHIPTNSTTPAVCVKILSDFPADVHHGLIEVYGDSTGGAKGTAKVQGTDWDLVRHYLRNGTPEHKGYGDRVQIMHKPQNPRERARVNAVNSRCRAADGTLRLYCDPIAAPAITKDLDGVRTLEGGSGELDKKRDPKLTHWSDALGYYVEFRFPVSSGLYAPTVRTVF